MIEILEKHERIALQLSGGKDSLACLYLMRPHLDRMTVYWLNTGQAFPETVETINKVAQFIPNFVEIKSDVDAVHREFGLPSDIVPASATPLGIFGGHGKTLIQDRYSCCYRVMMKPIQERMISDGVTLIIRGQRLDDKLKSPLRSGYVGPDGVELLFPIENWSEDQVFKYLHEVGAPIPGYYQYLDEAPDCMTCSAWWEKGVSKYLKLAHSEKYKIVQGRLDVINEAVSEHIIHFNKEVSQ